ncbi:MAG: phytanoyl-CoA dioxygenase family protein [Allosphingosinicella sp.]|uniref:phytanoyl-CoA dioxygenase family protein n=1 Tax=Allosphingosinicella sp. TaxID=2823234 RepID=UPI00392F6FC1
MQLSRDGARLFPAAAAPPILAELDRLLAGADAARPGHRLAGSPALAALLAAEGAIGRLAAALLGPAAKPVRALLLDKTPRANWSLAWHQDRTIAVRRRVDLPGFGNWTRKSGILHVEPPPDLLARMLTLRVHLDPVGADNGPLLVAPGSHLLGRIAERDIPAAVDRLGSVACLAARGDVWAYATPILHASHKAAAPTRRRVLQIDYSADTLPGALEWHGI